MRKLTAKSYLFILSLMGLLLFAAFGTNLLVQGAEIKQAISQERARAANSELQRAVEKVFEKTENILNELAQWDEVHQQLGDPTYYVYWREMRLKRSERFPAYVHGNELYDVNKKTLISLPYQTFPTKLPTYNRWLLDSKDRQYMMAYAPIPARGGEKGVDGYLALKIDFIEALRQLNRFVYIKPESIELSGNGKVPFNLKAAMSSLNYQLVKETTSSTFGELLRNSLRDYFILFVSMLVVFYMTIATLFIKPLVELGQYISRLRQGERDIHHDTGGVLPKVAELVTVRESLSEYQCELDSIRIKLDQQNVELWTLAHQDALTGVKNRLAFDEDWQELVQLAKNKRIEVSLLLLDCDFFKAINDTYGHEVGDRVIQSIAEILEGVLRDGEKLYRLGGDEFVTFLINAGRDGAHQVALRCVEAVQQHAFRQLGIKEKIKLSVGLAHANGTDIANLSELPRQADVAMYHAKGATREKIVHYTPSLEQEAAALVSNRIVGAVLHALESGEGIMMHYQPVVRASDHLPVYYEALVRMRSDSGIISPTDIFPIISRRRLDVELDKAVLRAVEGDLRKGLFQKGVGVSINVSGAFLVVNGFCELFEGLSRFLDDHPIIIEVTETNFISHLQHASECLQKMRKHGFQVALDDFGSGYSSIRYLANMPVDIVKFDISMIHDLNKDERTRIIIEHTANMIKEAGYKLVAEGIDSAETLRRVAPIKPTHLQGYYFGHPQVLEKKTIAI